MGFGAYIARIIKSAVQGLGVESTVEDVPANQKNAAHIFPPGFESRPIDDACGGICIPVGENNAQTAVLGVFPSSVETDKGETRLYAMDSSGTVVCEIRLYKDGKIRLENDVSYIQLDKDGNIKLDSAGGTINMADDGEILVNNTNGQFYLGSDGVLNVNAGNLTVDP